MALKIEEIPSGRHGMKTMRISGFAEGELQMLKRTEHDEASERLLDMLDSRNNRIATCWHNGPGIWGIWYDNEYAYINIGSSCD